ncbi:MAG: hydrogenase 4 subunit B [Parcubacteria group bacterium]|jgi:hydrogenase-4 component B
MLGSISAQTIFFVTLVFLALGAIGSLVFRKSDALVNVWGNGMAILASISGLICSVLVMTQGKTFAYSIASTLPMLDISFQVDQLAAFFIFVISLIALFASLYGLGYVKHFYGKYDIGSLGFFYNLFIAGMLLVASAHNGLFFLIVWELMSLASYFLVIFENKEKENVRAGSLYFIMTHVGTAFITLAFLLLYRATGSFDFSVIKDNASMLTPMMSGFIFILMLIGFGTKAGIIPLHIWLPSAHPAAPTHVSALMSGVMIKTGIYMLIRIFIDLMPNLPIWCGMLVLVIGAVSSLVGVLYALTEHDIKRLLAYHSIENIGIILLGLGSSLVFLALDLKTLAVLALVAALFHTLNHAIFKSLLFLGAGSVISKTHTRNMEDYGGLIKYMPQTAFFFLIGSLAISALPPFNGFFSEWLTFQALFSGIGGLDVSVQWVFILAAGALAFTGGLAAACFVKAFGATFLARPRSEHVKQASEVGLTLRMSMAVLATLTLVVGLLSGMVSRMLVHVSQSLTIFDATSSPFSQITGLNFSLQSGFASVSTPFIFISLLVALLLAFYVVRTLSRGRKVSCGRTWDCGTTLAPRMEITATGFARSIVVIFKGILKPTKQTTVEYRDADIRYFPKTNVVRLEIEDFWKLHFYQPAQRGIIKIAESIKKIQSGNVNAYILYIFLTLIALLLFLAI